jgi:hypothetical protein
MSNPFEVLSSLSKRTKRLRVVDNDDVVEVREQWSEEQLKLPVEKRGAPENGARIGVSESAASSGEIEIQRLSDAHEKQAEDMVRAVMPKPKFRTIPGKPGEPPRQEQDGWDEEDPEFIDRREEARANQAAFIVLRGVVGLHDTTKGEGDDEKIKEIRATLDRKLIRNIASAIFTWSYSLGSTADFFTSANSASATPSSGSSPKNPSGRKIKK